MPLSQAQKAAKKRWREKNREKERYYSRKSAAKNFIRDFATFDDLKELEEEILKKLGKRG